MLLTLFVITIVCFSLAYKFYGGFQSRYYGLDPERTTPAKELQDNIDYCPAHPAVLMGVNGELSSVSIDYMDNEIMDAAPLDEFKMVTLVGFILAHSRHGVSDSFIAERIEALIEKNELNVIKRAKKREDYYRDTILKRAKDFDYTTLNLNKNVCSDPDL